jgi:5S rRNA maturation endonuclease (ribonuclease M5)
MYLSRDEMQNVLKDIDMLKSREQVNINHEECSAGTDTKKRLYVKRVEDGRNNTYLFYCHHCGNRGSLKYYDGLRRIEEIAKETTATVKSSAVELLTELDRFGHGTFSIHAWSFDAKFWWCGYDLDGDDAVSHCVQYNAVDDRLWLKVADGLWQGRGFGDARKKMKYYTVGDITASKVFVKNKRSTVMLVEDVVSAYKCAKAGINVLPLLGTTLRPHHLSLVKKYDRVIIYMDNDTAGQKAAVNIYKELSPYNNDLDVIHDTKQPKERPLEELQHYATI